MKVVKNTNTTKSDIKALIPVLIALCIIPLVVLTKDFQTEFTQFVWFNNTELNQIDSFEYTKGILVILMGAVAALLLGWNEYKNIQNKKRLFENADIVVCVLWAVYLMMVILSSVLSDYPNLAFTGGGYSQWQTMWVLLGYGILFMYAYTLINSENRALLTIRFMMITTGLLALLGTLQTAGHNPLAWDWVQKIVTSRSSIEGISFQEGISSVILTFNNPNYVGPYVALVFPVAVSFAATKISENKAKAIAGRIAGVLIAAGLVVCLIGCSSSAGVISVLAGIGFALILILSGLFFPKKETWREKAETKKTEAKKIEQKKTEGEETEKTTPKTSHKKGIIFCGAAIVILGVAGVLFARSSLFESTVNKLLQGGEDTRNIASIANKKNQLKVTLRNDTKFTLSMKLDKTENLSFTAEGADKQPIAVPCQSDNGYYILDDERFGMITLVPGKYNIENNTYTGFVFNDVPNTISWTFMYVDGQWKYYTPFGKFMKLHEVENFGFKNYQNIANRRGFIWSRTIPLMKDYWFTGVGPNAFIIAFPNDDFVGSKRVGNTSTLVDKPHNAFLQIYIQTGGISAIAYVGLWLWYLIGGIRLFWRRRPGTDIEKIGFGLLIGIFSFAVAGLTNDTVIGSQNIYWILLGAGYAANRIIRQKRGSHETL